MVAVLSAWLGSSFADAPQPSDASHVNAGTLRLRVVVNQGTDAATVKLAKTIASELLGYALIQPEWQDDGRPESGAGPVQVIVRLLPHRNASQPDVSGEVARDARTHTPTALVYMPRIADLLRAIRVSTLGRSHPTLAGIELGHLAGLTVAHEVGHILGLSHASSGVMKARPQLDDLLKLRSSELTFLPQDVARMRQAVVALAGKSGPYDESPTRRSRSAKRGSARRLSSFGSLLSHTIH